MSVETDVATKLTNLKNTVDGSLHELVTKLEAIFQHVTNSHTEDVVKAAVVTDVNDAASHVAVIADTMRSDVDVAAKTVDTVDNAVDATVSK